MPSMTFDQAFSAALAQFQAGNLAAAESICRQVLCHQSNHANTLGLLGVIAYQVGQNAPAEELLRAAIAACPSDVIHHGNLGLVLRAQGRMHDAIACYRNALS